MGMVASAVAALVLATSDLARAYYGTDTRAYQLLAGALLAHDGEQRFVRPMKDSPAAKAMSVGKIRSKSDRANWR